MTCYMTRIGMAGLGVLLLAAPLFAEEQLVLKSRTDKESYSAGVEFVRTLRQRAGAINLDLVIRGMQDELSGERPPMANEEPRAAQSPAPALNGPASQAAPASPSVEQSAPEAAEPQLVQDGQGATVASLGGGKKGGQAKPAQSLVPKRYQQPRLSSTERQQMRARTISNEMSRQPQQSEPAPSSMTPAEGGEFDANAMGPAPAEAVDGPM